MKTNFKFSIVIALIALLTNNVQGQLFDNTFNSTGVWTRQDRNYLNHINSIIVQPDGKILYCGYTLDNTPSVDPSYFVIGRINSDGTNDNSFDADGFNEYTFNTGGYDEAYSTCYLNGKIYAAGSNISGTTAYSLLAKFNLDGSLDNSFNGNGKLEPIIESSSNSSLVVLKTNDGNIITLGSSSSGASVFHLSAFKVDESANYINGFGNSGKSILNTMTGSFKYDQVEMQTNNSILLLASGNLIKIKANGHLDSTFGVNGALDLSSISSNTMEGLATQKDGKIILCNGDDYKFSVFRLNTDGSLDNTFGTNGKVVVPFNGATNLASSVVVDTSSTTGKIFVTGYSSYNSGTVSYFALARLSSTDGSIEARAEFKPNNLNASPTDILIQTDGKILISGGSVGYTTEDFIITRINPNFVTDVVAGVQDDISTSIGLNLFPNPASQNINIHSSAKVANIKVVDILGNEVLNMSSNGNTQLDISALPKGLYNFVITTDKGTGTKKISIQ